MVHKAIMTLTALLSLTLCVPFVPGGGEIALAMIGPKIVFLLYVNTIAINLPRNFLIGGSGDCRRAGASDDAFLGPSVLGH